MTTTATTTSDVVGTATAKTNAELKKEGVKTKKLNIGGPIFPEPKKPEIKTTTIKFKETFHDFGDVPLDTEVTHTFEFTNTGKEDLIIEFATGSCGCTVPEYSSTPIPPGEKGSIKVDFNSKDKDLGENLNDVTILLNTVLGVEELKIRANVTEK